jgi:hypothetical protein
MMIKSKDRTEPASVVSALINHLQDAWEKDLHLYAFVARDSNLALKSVVEAVLAK